jgi:uncharacterized damage-inducible protein DinB
MTDALDKDTLLDKIDAKWEDLWVYLSGITLDERTRPADAGGWTVKDHAIHLSLWEDNLLALLDGRSRADAFGVSPETWASGSDAVNAVLYERHRDRPWLDVRRAMIDSHTRVLARLDSMSEAELHLPYKHYQPTTRRSRPVVEWVSGNTWHHYGQHLRWMKAITGTPLKEKPIAGVLRSAESKFDELWAFLTGLSAEQFAGRADAGGWTVKDHAIHLSRWHDTFPALLDGESRAVALGVTQEQWDAVRSSPNGWDEINGLIQRQERDTPPDEVLRRLREGQERVLGRIRAMSDADAMRPYSHYQPSSTLDIPVVHWMRINTFDHYDEHLDWMREIAEGGSDGG